MGSEPTMFASRPNYIAEAMKKLAKDRKCRRCNWRGDDPVKSATPGWLFECPRCGSQV